ncbi:hypothetical protein K488DRAFT_83555 [Vararia minispora EC-137]|uniref:Uncharacterized protein n=1 Tax=Vararia minispora EC-137 TaxID=1314806 RepID=A0ACB8QTL6_9AGAM|nr:hypothetical protein K488DRAFT_83555 [Vararia minispora EC-137]
MQSVAAHSPRTQESVYRPDLSSSSPTMPSKSLIASTWHLLEQAPPPSLREILNAYRARGDGDRDMLLAMLNAKSAEDQRIAAIATLHRSMLEYYSQPQQPSPAPAPPPHAHYHAHHLPHPSDRSHPAHHHPRAHSPPRARQYRSPDSPAADDHDHDQPRKRHRRSPSPRSPGSSPHSSASAVPSSPYSDAPRSPGARSAMAIDSLLHEAARRRPDDREHYPQLPPLFILYKYTRTPLNDRAVIDWTDVRAERGTCAVGERKHGKAAGVQSIRTRKHGTNAAESSLDCARPRHRGK